MLLSLTKEFQEMLKSYGVRSKLIIVKNPQANAAVERVHYTIGNILRTCRDDVTH